MPSESPEKFKKSIRAYVWVFVGLLGLMGLSVWAAYWKVAAPIATAIVIGIACAMGSLVVVFFMELKSEKPIIFLLLLLALILLLAILILPLAGSFLTTKHYAG